MSNKSIPPNNLGTSEVKLTVNVPSGKTLVAKLENTTAIPYYYRIGNGKRNNLLGRGITAMNTLQELCKFTPQEQFLFAKLEEHLLEEDAVNDKGTHFKVKTNVAVIVNKNFTSAEQQKIKAGFKRLNSKDIVRRLKRQHYIINPQFLVPYDYAKTKQLWDSCK